MTRDYSQFLSPSTGAGKTPGSVLQGLGWRNFFAQQTDADEMVATPPVRVTQVHRNGLHVVGDGIDELVPPGPEATVGDWLMLNREAPAQSRVLERTSLIKRRAAGLERVMQMIAANLDTAFIATSCNQDFNVARLERYIALAMEAEVAPVIVLTKPDLAEDPESFAAEARKISDRVPVVVVNAKGEAVAEALAEWCRPGQTVAFMGSSGVGKSTLTNALSKDEAIETQAIREADARGRHTTTRRQLHFVPGGCAVLDTPGMRELQMTDAEAGIGDLFSDLRDLGEGCKFRDCAHETEPGCAVLAALERGEIDGARIKRWKKLVAEERFNSESLSERRMRDKSFGKMVRKVVKNSRKK
ncbi:ribosome small subunit-dependent GTPase A [Oceanicola sp. 502str15]|nr:ribosome small subunit-dependent GTPase A [Oceanicola sp. 502str15]